MGIIAKLVAQRLGTNLRVEIHRGNSRIIGFRPNEEGDNGGEGTDTEAI